MRVAFKTVVLILVFCAPVAQGEQDASLWWSMNAAGTHEVRLYFFWTETCPHCQRAQPDVRRTAGELPWLQLESLNLNADPAHGRRYAELAEQVGQRPLSVPAFLFCGQMLTGYDDAPGMGASLRESLRACKATLDAGGDPLVSSPPEDGRTRLPAFGEVDLSAWSLPAVAVTLGLLDSFNPCAFFVLLFLIFLWISKLDGTLRFVSYIVLICAAVLFIISIIGICSFMVTKKKEK